MPLDINANADIFDINDFDSAELQATAVNEKQRSTKTVTPVAGTQNTIAIIQTPAIISDETIASIFASVAQQLGTADLNAQILTGVAVPELEGYTPKIVCSSRLIMSKNPPEEIVE